MALLGTGVTRDRKVLEDIGPILDALWPLLRFLTDLETVWVDLDPEKQREIEESRPFQERFHERLAQGYLKALGQLTQQLGSAQYRGLRDELSQFLKNWQDEEPDKLKVFSAMVRSSSEAA